MVTGAAGFIGSHLVERLVDAGWEVRAVDCLTSYYSVEQKRQTLRTLQLLPGCRVIRADLRTCAMAELLDGVDVVFHQAGQPGVRDSWEGFDEYVAQNLLVTQRLLAATQRSSVRRFVYASSSSVYGDASRHPTSEDALPKPVSPYGATKLAAEHLCGVYAGLGVATVSLRYFTVYGPRQRPEMALSRFLFAALRGRPVDVFGDGGQQRDMTYVADAVEATVAALGAPAGVYNVGGGNRASVGEMIEAVKEVTGKDFEVRHGAEAQGDVKSTWADSRRAERVLGYRPRVGLEEGVAAQARWAARALVAAPA